MDSPSATWSTAKSFMGWKTTGTPHQLEVNTVLETKAARIATVMNDYFIDKVRSISENMADVPETFVECVRLIVGKRCSLALNYVNISTVKKLIMSLKNEVQGLMNLTAILSNCLLNI